MRLELRRGFALLKEIIHVYAPIYSQEQDPLKKLKECYLNLFEVIKKEEYKTVVIPSLATGFHFYKHEEVAEMVISLLEEFCTKNSDITIIFNLYNEKIADIYKKYIGKK